MSDPDGLYLALLEVSDPLSPRYGQHLSQAEIQKLVAPKPESLKAVTDWLAASNLTWSSASASGEILKLEITVAEANALLSADYTTYEHPETGAEVVGTPYYSVPASVKDHITFIYPTTQFIPPLRRPAVQIVQPAREQDLTGLHATKKASCVAEITPECLQALYRIPTAPATGSGSIAVSGFLSEVASQSDLDAFLDKFRPDTTNSTFSVQTLDGGSNEGNGTAEASLDIQYTVGLATNVPTTFVSVGSQNQDGVAGFLDIIKFLLEQETPPLVLTTSFGIDEPFLVDSPGIAQTLCAAYAQLGARGTSVLFASGDGGVAGSRPSDSCETFVPTFPGGCPFITSVGSTTGVAPETAAPFSAGGFSNIFPRPDYQSAAVDAYLQTLGSANAGLFNATGRAYPDVSTQGSNFQVNVNGVVQSVSGTSASSPTFASIVALLNDKRLSAGLPPLGFLNPLLYSGNASSAFNDVTSGSNPGCGTDGFPAASGWDPVTGLGTPDFEKLLALAGVA
ncbi:family S53 protease-like protein [Earliella scabrosa]|nr:family S53 protease-like protein [Earliella scabrosa]